MLLTEFNVEEYYEVGVEEGMAKGLAEGEARGEVRVVQEKKEAALRMRTNGLDESLIAKCLDISEKELGEILDV